MCRHLRGVMKFLHGNPYSTTEKDCPDADSPFMNQRILLAIEKKLERRETQFLVHDGTTYGFTYEGKIYLNSDVMNSNVAVHESHLRRKYHELLIIIIGFPPLNNKWNSVTMQWD